MRRAAVHLALLSLALAGCEDESRFRTDEGAVFRGTVVGGEGDSFIRRGFRAGTEMELDFDASIADRPSERHRITTRHPETGEMVFDATLLEPIGPLQHDLLSEYDFPGAGRLRNFVYVARPSAGALADRDAMIFVSLLDDGAIEVRVIAGSGDEARGDHFGLFRLGRRPR